MNHAVEIPANAPKLCVCGRSATGFCTGLHALSDQEWNARVFDEAFQESVVTAPKEENP